MAWSTYDGDFSMPLPRGIDWRLALILLMAGLVGFASIIPLVMEWWPRLLGPEGEAELRELPLPIPVIFVLGAVQNGLILGAAIVAGLALGKRVGLGAPELEAWRAGALRPGLGRRLALAAVIGLITGLVLIGVDALLLLPRTGVDLAKWMAGIPLWKRLLAGVFYGGITEELLVRLFVVTALVWALGKVWRTSDARPAPGAVWTAIVIATLLFALGHLPMASRLGELTPWLVVRVLVLNGIAGMLYGWLYTRRGLEAAIAAHAATHIPLQVLAGVAASVAQSVG
jgi:membrane protease YdiL (CAAX protease family)